MGSQLLKYCEIQRWVLVIWYSYPYIEAHTLVFRNLHPIARAKIGQLYDY
jgi:hypothetical protein